MDRFSAARRQFAVTGHRIYFDLANQGPVPLCVLEELSRLHTEAYRRGPDKNTYLQRVETVRGQLATMLHCRRAEIAFVKNTSEAINVAAAGISYRAGDNVVVSHFEHPNNVYPWLALERRGVEVRMARPSGRVAIEEDLISLIDGRTRAVACSAVSFMPGERLDLGRLAEACHQNGAYLVVDAVQGAGIIDLDVPSLGVDVLAAGCHKGLLTPHGVGLLYCRRDVCASITPPFAARDGMKRQKPMEQETYEYAYAPLDDARRFEIGNYNYSGVSALGRAVELLLGLGLRNVQRRALDLGTRLIGGLCRLPGVEVWTPVEAGRRAGIVGFAVEDVERAAAALLDAGVVFSIRRGAIRFSLGFYNTPDEVDRALAVLEEVVN